MKIVFLDSETIPREIPVPYWVESWINLNLAPDESTVEALREADIALTNKVKITRSDLENLPHLKYVCVTASGYDCIDIEACKEHGVLVSHVPDYSSSSVAEAVVASIFALRRQLLSYAQASYDHWSNSTCFCVHQAPVQDVHGATLGIVGKGGIGRRVAELAQALGMNVLFAERKGAKNVRSGYVAFEDCLRSSDVITLHCPAVPGAAHMMAQQEFAAMKPGACLINTSRGSLVDEQALLDALQSGHLGGASLDVLDVEPPSQGHPLIRHQHPHLIVTPHVAWASISSIDNLIARVEENLAAFYMGKPVNMVWEA